MGEWEWGGEEDGGAEEGRLWERVLDLVVKEERCRERSPLEYRDRWISGCVYIVKPLFLMRLMPSVVRAQGE
jgi:hypothetical protein